MKMSINVLLRWYTLPEQVLLLERIAYAWTILQQEELFRDSRIYVVMHALQITSARFYNNDLVIDGRCDPELKLLIKENLSEIIKSDLELNSKKTCEKTSFIYSGMIQDLKRLSFLN
jgi:hypothetical protein